MKKFKAILNFIFNVIEVHIPSILFFVLFIFYIVMIAYRYLFNKQFNDIFEFSVIIFLWCTLLAASFGGRSGKHIMFTILYDKLSEGKKLLFRVIGNLFIITTFIILAPYAYESVSFEAKNVTSILKIPYSIVDFPILVFIGLTLIHYSLLLVKDIKQIFYIKKGRNRV